MTTGELMSELFWKLHPLSDVDIITEYGIDHLQFKIAATKTLKKLWLARMYIPIGNSYIGLN